MENKNTMTKEEILKQCTIEGNVVFLPKIKLERELYLQVAKALNLIGGRWKTGKVSGFMFPDDPTDLLNAIQNGEKTNLKKKYQFFPTPPEIADYLVKLAEPKAEETILEPSAGQGALIQAIQRVLPEKEVTCFELMELNHKFLWKIQGAKLVGSDFLEHVSEDKARYIESLDESFGRPYVGIKKYDLIIANPPFSKNQDIDHIRAMFECLNNGGRIVTIASNHWLKSENKKETEFRNWLNDSFKTTYFEKIESGSFKESGTMVSALILIIRKV